MIFLGPVTTSNGQTVVFGLVTDALRVVVANALDELLLILAGVSAIGAFLARATSAERPGTSLPVQLFQTGWPWVLLRCLGFAVIAMVYTDAGPQLMRLPDTGVTAVKDIGENILIIYFSGLLLMPLLTEYGLMEFVGTLCQPFFRRLFRLPGRAAIDSLTSVAAASGIAVLVTVSQYNRGYYTTREACTIACNFSLVSIPFSLLISQVAGIEQVFFGWYLSVLAACLLCAVVLARIAPLARLPDTTVHDVPPRASEDAGGLKASWHNALERAARGPGPGDYLRQSLRSFLVTAAGLIPPSVAVATLAAILLFHSPVVSALTWPLAQLLACFDVQQGANVANGLVIGFADQFMPALVAGQVASTFWKFVLAGLAVSQVIFMSEFCILILRSPLPLNLWQLAWLFGLRTVLTLPVLMLGAGLIAP